MDPNYIAAPAQDGLAKKASLMETSGSLASQANDLLSALRHIEDHLNGGSPREITGGSIGGVTPVSPALASQLRDTSHTLRAASDTASRIKQSIGI